MEGVFEGCRSAIIASISRPDMDNVRVLVGGLDAVDMGEGWPRPKDGPPVFCGRRTPVPILFPYSSPFFLAWPFSATGGAPKPKLPLGTGVPPFCSNFAILSFKLPTLPALEEAFALVMGADVDR